MDKKRVLIAEDDPMLREVYVKKFTIAGYDIHTAPNGAEVCKAIEEHAPDILILDINMPVMDGFAVLAKYPKESRNFPVILLTNYNDELSHEKGKELGADDYFIKSEMTIRKLLDMVANLLS